MIPGTPRFSFGAACVVLLTAVPGFADVALGNGNHWTISDPAPNTLSFWGHAACYLDLAGVGIVTDPVFAPRLAHIFPRIAPAPERTAYDQTRIVLISHAHRDHLHPATLTTFPAATTILCPEPSIPYLGPMAATVEGMVPGDRWEFPGGTVIAVAAYHPGGRNSLAASADGGALGYVIVTPERTIYYTGDTAYFAGFQAVGAAYAPDLVLLNLNAHLTATDAARALQDLGSPPAVLLHHGAYATLNELRWSRWRDDLTATGTRVFDLAVGESRPLAALSAPRMLRMVVN
jgi:L-ascorbate metabolism protein UlaG (beta-lactamase superfamily)